MTQYMLKLLTILTNILISNLQLIEKDTANKFLSQIITAIKKSPEALQIVQLPSVSDEALFVGLSLLKELNFKFITYTCSDVSDKQLSKLLIREFITIQ
jgi:predicted nuclease of predicted toxin-antitoxin system